MCSRRIHEAHEPHCDNSDTRKNGECIVGVVRQGTRLRFLYMNVLHGLSPWYGYTTYRSPVSEILDGDYSGWKVDIADISLWFPEKHIDAKIIRKIADGEECLR